MKKFLFLIPQSPKKSVSAFRQNLIDVSLESLRNQRCADWEALLLGEENRSEGNFNYIISPGKTKEEKLDFAVGLLLKEQHLPQYIIRFDDDDLISPLVLEKVSALDFDCYADEHHWFYDAGSGRLSAQKRNWLANTVIHKTEHALAEYGEYHAHVKGGNRSPRLVQNDHSKTWHRYYSDKKLLFAPKETPVYIRVLSPTSITAGAAGFDREKYAAYLESFGTWDANTPAEFQPYLEELKKAWLKEYGAMLQYKTAYAKKIKSKLRNLFGK